MDQVKTIQVNSGSSGIIQMRVDRDTTYQDVKDYVALSYGYMNWHDVWKDTSLHGTTVFNAAIDMVDKLRNLDWNDQV